MIISRTFLLIFGRKKINQSCKIKCDQTLRLWQKDSNSLRYGFNFFLKSQSIIAPYINQKSPSPLQFAEMLEILHCFFCTDLITQKANF